MVEAAGAQLVVRPDDLLGGNMRPRSLALRPQRASYFTTAYNLALHGADIEVSMILPLSRLRQGNLPRALTYLSSERYADNVLHLKETVIITSSHLVERIPSHNCILVTEHDPKEIFYTILMDAATKGHFEALSGQISRSAKIASSAVVHTNVVVSDGALIGDNAVILPNTFVGPGAVVKPNATIGGNGFETAIIGGRKRIVEHGGGTWLSADVEIGSSTCVDRGLFGEFTFLGEETKVDNLVHVAHGAQIGKLCSVIACSEISGSCVLEDGVWLGPNVSINQMVNVGAHCFVGTAATVTRNLPAHALAFGSPAKVNGWVCDCRTKLSFGDGTDATCDQCGLRFVKTEHGIERLNVSQQ